VAPTRLRYNYRAMIYQTTISGLAVRTGDIICTQDGTGESLVGQLWRALGHFVPGEIDHVILYVGPGGRCVEAGAHGVIVFEVPDGSWSAEQMADTRLLYDTLVGVADPLAGRGLPPDEEERIRAGVAAYCLEQAVANKPYNFNIFDSQTDAAFYCSQLVYHAYLEYGVDLSRGEQDADVRDDVRLVLPQVIWQNSRRVRVKDAG
jgi:hypothetical protein